jgi:primosomal protein N' (replication factor Y)
MYYFEVAVIRAHTADKFFTYQSANPISIGSVIKVPFGKKQVLAIIVSRVSKPSFPTKAVAESPIFCLPESSVKLLLWMFDYYPEDNGLIAKLFLPNKLATPKAKSLVTVNGQGTALPTATKEQAKILNAIRGTKVKRVLLHGDTGTGKTRVFTEISQDILKKGQSVLILTPEIGLTPQLMNDLKKHLSSPLVLTHSEMTDTKRSQVWHLALNNTVPTVFVGPRSALFLPFKDLGLIVIDEAHDSSYKQLQSPKYQGLHVAGKLASLHNALLIQSTATPNVDEYETAQAHDFLILKMTQTAAGNQTSQTHVTDIRNRDEFTKSPHLSNALVGAIDKALLNKEQVMLFLNRRGSARLIQCANCGWQAICPNCNLPLVYHHDKYLARCHTCDYKETIGSLCPKCSSTDIIFKIIGTKSLAEHVSQLFPKAKIRRFDADSILGEKFHDYINVIKKGEVDIIIGTQLITKGIDLLKLSVVGVINADSSLNLPDYRAEELTFQQLYQVTGRAMRGHIKSKVFVQTRLPEHPVILAVKNRSWQDFYNYEMPKRLLFSYPPKTFLALLKITKKTPALAATKSNLLYRQLIKLKGLELLGPSPSFYEKTYKGYTWQIIIKSKKRSVLVNLIRSLPNDWVADVDPTSVL